MYFGNILTSSNIKEDNFKICKKLESIDETLPTLVIGWSKAKELFGSDISILHKKINGRLSWTFDSKERKSDYEIDLDKFKQDCINNFGNNIPYVYLDIIHYKLKVIKKIINKIKNLVDPYTYISDTNMLYIYGENIIFGIDLNVIDYTNISKQKIINKVLSIKNNTLIDEEIFNKCRGLLYNNKNKIKLIPYIVKNGNFE